MDARRLIHTSFALAFSFGVVAVGPTGCAHKGQGAPPPNLQPLTGPGAVGSPPPSQASAVAPTAPQLPPDPWPRQVNLGNATTLVYEPQVNSWNGNVLDFRCAVAVRPSGAKDESFGVIFATARTQVDRVDRRVTFENLKIYKSDFPLLPDKGAAYAAELQQQLATTVRTISLDRVEASLALVGIKPPSVTIQNTPPKIIVSYSPAILVSIDGAPVIKPVPDTRFERVINTRAFIARSKLERGTWYMHVYDGWLTASSLQGPWTQAFGAPWGLDDLAEKLAKSGTVDLLEGNPNMQPKPSLGAGVPAIYVSQVPAELIVFKGQPNLVPVTGTGLLRAMNTAADVLVDTNNNYYYVLISGRWYQAPGLTGPWSYVASNALPADFRNIPRDSPAGVVLASVAGTPQAQEAVIANSIPQTATIPRTNGPTYTPVFDGAPQFKPVQGTPLQYVVNSRVPLIRVDANTYYAVQAGVWFTATSLTGPWVVATSVPAVIYTIPPSSPLHYVTYVRIYEVTPEVVYAGYTPGYLGTVVSPDGVVVYGTGYDYQPWIGTTWYEPPITYGYAAAPVYNPYAGAAFGFAMGAAIGAMAAEPYYGGAYYHPGYYGYPCCGTVSANVYRSYGDAVSSGTRSWYNTGTTVGTSGYGNYENYRTGTTGTYSGGRSYDAATGQASEGYERSFNTPGGTTGSASRSQTYDPYTGQRTYNSSVSGTGPGGSSATRTTADSAGPGAFRPSTRPRSTTLVLDKPTPTAPAATATTGTPTPMATFTRTTAAAGRSRPRAAGKARSRRNPHGPTASSRRAARASKGQAASAVEVAIAGRAATAAAVGVIVPAVEEVGVAVAGAIAPAEVAVGAITSVAAAVSGIGSEAAGSAVVDMEASAAERAGRL